VRETRGHKTSKQTNVIHCTNMTAMMEVRTLQTSVQSDTQCQAHMDAMAEQ